jgi:hypothetical protein
MYNRRRDRRLSADRVEKVVVGGQRVRELLLHDMFVVLAFYVM